MRKQHVVLSVTLHSDSQTGWWFVEHGSGDGDWGLTNEGPLLPSKLPSDLFAALLEALSEATAAAWSSTNSTSDLG